MFMQRAVYVAVTAVLVASAFVVGTMVGEGRVPAVDTVLGLEHKTGDVLTAAVGSDPVDFAPYWRVWNTLERKFVPFSTSTAAGVAIEDRVFESIEGLVASYQDPYTVFMRPTVSEDFKIATRGSLEGIGAVIGEREGMLLIVSPLPNSPAEGAGLLSGDRIMAIDGESTEGLSTEDAVQRIRGQAEQRLCLLSSARVKTNET